MKKYWNSGFIISLLDVSLSIISLLFAYLLRFNFAIPNSEVATFKYVFLIAFVIRISFFYFFHLNKIIIKFVSINDVKKIIQAITAGTLVLILITAISFYYFKFNVIPRSIIIIDWLCNALFLLGYRMIIRSYNELNETRKSAKKVIIFGAGEAGMVTKKTLERNVNEPYEVIAFIDDDTKLINKKIDNIPIYSASIDIDILLNKMQPDLIVIAILNLPKNRKNELVNSALQHKIKILNLPHVSTWTNGELQANQLQQIKFEDLLERDSITLNNLEIETTIQGKTIVITGAGGSIGSELARQVLLFRPAKLVLIDTAESH
jgi:FlaA1/EpsC-like NDP-sugar epimerase